MTEVEDPSRPKPAEDRSSGAVGAARLVGHRDELAAGPLMDGGGIHAAPVPHLGRRMRDRDPCRDPSAVYGAHGVFGAGPAIAPRSVMTSRNARTVALALCAMTFAPGARQAAACGGRATAAATALPTAGATTVSPHTSIILLGGTSIPADLSFEANGLPLPLPAISVIGDGVANLGLARYWRLETELEPSTEYVLRGRGDGGAVRELTRFSTASGYDKAAGTPPVLKQLRLWQVRYDRALVAGGSCVFDEFEGYVDLKHDEGALPGTPLGEVVQVVTLAPKSGGATQSFVFPGGAPYPTPIEALLTGGDPGRPTAATPALAAWRPVLLADREYCARITIYGRNDRAIAPVQSNELCAPVVAIDDRTAVPGFDGGAPVVHDDAGVTQAPAHDASGTPHDAGFAGAPPSSAGCTFAPAVASRASGGVPLVIALVALARNCTRRRRR